MRRTEETVLLPGAGVRADKQDAGRSLAKEHKRWGWRKGDAALPKERTLVFEETKSGPVRK